MMTERDIEVLLSSYTHITQCVYLHLCHASHGSSSRTSLDWSTHCERVGLVIGHLAKVFQTPNAFYRNAVSVHLHQTSQTATAASINQGTTGKVHLYGQPRCVSVLFAQRHQAERAERSCRGNTQGTDAEWKPRYFWIQKPKRNLALHQCSSIIRLLDYGLRSNVLNDSTVLLVKSKSAISPFEEYTTA